MVSFTAVDLDLTLQLGKGFTNSAAFGFELLSGGFNSSFGGGNLGLQVLLQGGFAL